MKKLFAILLAMVMVLGLVACGGSSAPATEAPAAEAPAATEAPAAEAPTADDKFTVAYVCKDLSQEWFIVEAAAINEVITAAGCETLIEVDCEYNEEKYIDGVQNMVEQKVDVLIVCPPDQNLSQRTVEMCSAAGIPVIAIDDPLIDENGKLLAPAIQLSAYNVGVGMGEWLNNYIETEALPTEGDEIMVVCLAADTIASCVPRTDGQIDTVSAKYPNLTILRTDYESTTISGEEVMNATIAANPQVKYWCVMAVNDEGSLGALRALEAAGLAGDAVVIGAGAYHFDDEIYNNPETAFKAALYFSSNEAGTMLGNEIVNYKNTGAEMCGDSIEEGENFGRKYFAGSCVDATNYLDVMNPADLSVG